MTLCFTISQSCCKKAFSYDKTRLVCIKNKPHLHGKTNGFDVQTRLLLHLNAPNQLWVRRIFDAQW